VCAVDTVCANQIYNVELGTTAVIRCSPSTTLDYPAWQFIFPNDTSIRVNINERFNPALPSDVRIYWINRKNLEIRSVTREDQGRFTYSLTETVNWIIQLRVIGTFITKFTIK